MALSSMTGYARASNTDDLFSWVWEVRSLNGKLLEMRIRLPGGWERLDPVVRGMAQKKLKRGNLNISLEIRSLQQSQSVQINEEFLAQLSAFCHKRGEVPLLDRLLQVRGAVELVESKSDNFITDERILALQQTLENALDDLAVNRREEGARIESVLTAHIDAIEKLIACAEKNESLKPENMTKRFTDQIQEFLNDTQMIAKDRLAQEVALLAGKADVREELDRLSAHVLAARDLLKSQTAVGRKLDFLSQEFNREANTICSKSSDIELTKIGLELKAAIDQFREQSANIE